MTDYDRDWHVRHHQPSKSSVVKRLAKVKQDQAIVARHAVLNGNFFDIPSVDEQPGSSSPDWRIPSFSLRVYISSASTNADGKFDFLMYDLLSKLRTIAREFEITVDFVETNYGWQQGNNLMRRCQLTNAALAEIERCRESSMSSFFLSLQSEILGDCPLPTDIPRENFENRMFSTSSELNDLANQFYFLDSNGLPHGQYSLRCSDNNPPAIQYHDLENQVSRLVLGFDGVVFVNGLRIGCSIASYETKTAARMGEDKTRLLWITSDYTPKESLSSHDECKRDELLLWMYQKAFLPHLIRKFPRVSDESIRKDTGIPDCFQQFSTTYFQSMLAEIVELKKCWDFDGLGLGIPGDVLTEIIHHYQIAREYCQIFHRREELLQRSMELININSIDNHWSSCDGTSSDIYSNYSCISLCIVGESGVGKTALIAKLSERTRRQLNASSSMAIPVLIRFCGLSPRGLTSTQLIVSICLQIHYLIGDIQKFQNLRSMNYIHLVQHLHQLLHSFPVVLFIDSLDCVFDEFYRRNDFDFLRELNPKPHPNTRIIVSMTRLDPVLHLHGAGCETALLCARRPFISVVGLSPGESRVILEFMLFEVSRTLTTAQWAIVETALSSGGGRSVLYLHLVFQVVKCWTSITSLADCILASDVELMVIQLFHTLEREHGIPAAIVKAASHFLLCSTEGVTDMEMVNLLSLDEEVTKLWISTIESNQIDRYKHIERMVSHSWQRLRRVLQNLSFLFTKCNGCFTWRHQGIANILREYYENGSHHPYKYHRIMAHYFGDNITIDESSGILSLQQITEQPLLLNKATAHHSHELYSGSVWCSSAAINKRRCIEASHHMIEANMLVEAKLELCSLESICARAKLGLMSHVAQQLVRLMARLVMSQDASINSEVRQYFQWIRQNWDDICGNPCVQISLTASEQPIDSVVYRHAMEELYDRYKPASFTHFNIGNQNNPLNSDFIVTTSQIGGWETTGPLLTNFKGHSLEVLAVCLSSDKSMIASASRDKSVVLWDSMSGRRMRSLRGHKDVVTAVLISLDDTMIISASRDKTIKIWLLHSGLLLETLKGHTCAILTLAMTPDGLSIVSGSEDTTLKVWSLHPCVLGNTLDGQHTSAILTVVVSPNGVTIASGSSDGIINIWNLSTCYVIYTLTGHFGPVRSMSISRDGNSIVSGSEDRTVRVWDINTGALIVRIDSHKSPVIAVAITKDGSKVVTGSMKEPIKIWDVSKGTVKDSFTGPVNQASSLFLSRDEDLLVSGSNDHSVNMWNFESLQEAAKSATKEGPLIGHRGAVTCIRISVDGKLLVSASEDKTIKIWDLTLRSLLLSLTGHSKAVTSLALSLDGNTIVSGSKDKFVRVWYLQRQYENDESIAIVSETTVLAGHLDAVVAVAVSGNGSTAVSGASDSTFRIWDIKSRCQLFSMSEHNDRITAVDITRDGSLAISASKHIINIWAVSHGSLLKSLRDVTMSVSVVSILPNGEAFLAAVEFHDTIHCWKLPSGEPQKSLGLGESSYLHSIAISEDSSTIIWAGGRNGSIVSWDVELGSQNYSLSMGSPLDTAPRSIAMSTDGMLLAWARSSVVKVSNILKTAV